VTGVSAFGGGTHAEVFARILERQPAPLLQHLPNAPPELEQIVSRALSKNRAERYPSARELLSDLSDLKRQLETTIGTPQKGGRVLPRKLVAAIVVASALVVIAAGVYLLRRPQPALTDRDAILLADFINTTGNAVFDGALKQGLSVQLEQSPFLDVFSDARIRQTLRLMGRPPEERVSREMARENSLRAGIKAFIVGSIAPLGNNYVVGLEAVNSQTAISLRANRSRPQVKSRFCKHWAKHRATS
jgi:hypothetical protein